MDVWKTEDYHLARNCVYYDFTSVLYNYERFVGSMRKVESFENDVLGNYN